MRTGLILAAVLPALFMVGCKKSSDETTTKAPTADEATTEAATADAPAAKTATADEATTQTATADAPAAKEATTKTATADAPTADEATTQTATADAPAAKEATTVAATAQTVEAGCGTCIYEMKDVTGCKLAVKIDGKAYLVSGKTMDDFGDAHAEDGLCSIARKAEVTGKLEGDRFVVTQMSLLPK